MNKRIVNIGNFLRKHMRTIIEVIGVTGVVIALLQLNIQQQQFTFEQQQVATQQAQKPELKYYYNVTPSFASPSKVFSIYEELEDELYTKIYEQKQLFPEKSYRQIMFSVVPLSRNVSVSTYLLQVEIQNSGITTATQVRIRVEASKEISSIEFEAKEPTQIIDGGVGNNFTTVEIDRLIPNDFAKIIIKLNNDSVETDRIIVYHPSDDDNPPELQSRDQDNEFTSLPPGGYYRFSFLPEMDWVFSNQPNIDLFISSNEGSATLSVLPLFP